MQSRAKLDSLIKKHRPLWSGILYTVFVSRLNKWYNGHASRGFWKSLRDELTQYYCRFWMSLHHFALTLQSFGVQWRHLGSILICLFSIAAACCSIISLWINMFCQWHIGRNPLYLQRSEISIQTVCTTRFFFLTTHWLFSQLPIQCNNILSFVVINEIQVLKRRYHIFFLNRGQLTYFTYRNLRLLIFY